MSESQPRQLPEQRSEFPVLRTITTRWHDNDIYGHVNNVTYYSYFDTVANTYLIEQGGLDIHQAQDVAGAAGHGADFEDAAIDQGAAGVAACAGEREHVRLRLPEAARAREDGGDRQVDRPAALERAQGALVAFLDDDAWAEPAWLTRLLAVYQEARVIGAGGGITPPAPITGSAMKAAMPSQAVRASIFQQGVRGCAICRRAASDIIDWFHGGSNTIRTVTSRPQAAW